jgi:nucleoside-diphosphate-sugar epimerase
VDHRPVLVTGAAGFIGARLVAALHQRGWCVRAGVRNPDRSRTLFADDIEIVHVDLFEPATLAAALRGVGTVHHFAALVDSRAPLTRLHETNVVGTRNLCTAALAAGVDRLVYCSTTAVYGLAAAAGHPIGEDVAARAMESYGRTKLEGERAAREITAGREMGLVVIRPTAVFGVGDNTGIGRALRRVAVSRVMMPGLDTDWNFSFVHVDDVVRAALHVAELNDCTGSVFNVAVEPPLTFAAAFSDYRRALRHGGRRFWRERALASLSAVVQQHANWSQGWPESLRRRWLHGVWRPGWDLTYSSARLRETGFVFKHTDFTEVLNDCLNSS